MVPCLRITPGKQRAPTRAKMIPYFRIETLHNPTLSGGTYLSNPCIGVPPPPPHSPQYLTNNVQTQRKT